MKYLLLIFVIACLASCKKNTSAPVTSGIISTIAGNGTQGYSGDGGPATFAELSAPSGVAVDGNGNLYIADIENNRIRKVSTSGIITAIAGNGTAGYSGDGGPADSAQLNYPSGVAVDGAGNVYIADESNNVIRKVSTSGMITTIAGFGSPGYSGDGNLATAAQLNMPYGVAVDGSGNIYIADYQNMCIRKVNTSGIITTIAGNGNSGTVTIGYSGDGGAADSALLDDPLGVAVDGNGNVYIADYANNVVRKINTSGIISTFAGTGVRGYSGDGGLADTAVLFEPEGVAVDHSGNVYIADAENNRIRKVSASGIITTIGGDGSGGYSGDGGAATSAELYTPAVAVDNVGNVYIADNGNDRIRKISK